MGSGVTGVVLDLKQAPMSLPSLSAIKVEIQQMILKDSIQTKACILGV